MKPFPILTTLFISSALVMGNLQAATIWESDFSDTNVFAPTDSTVIGHGNWVAGYSGMQSGNPDDAHIATLNGTRVLAINSSVTSGNGFSSIRNALGVTDSIVRVQFGLGFSAATNIESGGGIYFGPWDYSMPLSVTYFGNPTTGGLRFTGLNGSQILLERSLIKTDYLYQFDITLNYTTKTFSLTFTGEDINGNPINLTYSDIGFISGTGTAFNSLGNLYVSNNIGRFSTMYVDRILVTDAIPEPSATAGLAVGVLLLGGGALGWRKRPAIRR